MFEGMERGEQIIVDPRIMAQGYRLRFEEYLQSLRRGCREKNIDYQQMTLSEPYERTLTAYLTRRK